MAKELRCASCGGHLTVLDGLVYEEVVVNPRTGRLERRLAMGNYLACDACEAVVPAVEARAERAADERWQQQNG